MGLVRAWILVLFTVLAGRAIAADVPRHRGPLTPSELKTIVKRERATTAKSYRAAAKRYLAAEQAGRAWKGTKYEIIEKGGQKYLVEKGVTAEQIDLKNHALITSVGSVHVQVNLERHEAGKATPTILGIRYNAGETFEPRRGSTQMTIVETRSSTAANRATPNARSSMRMYEGPRWKETLAHENDGWGNRDGKKVGLGHEARYKPASSP